MPVALGSGLKKQKMDRQQQGAPSGLPRKISFPWPLEERLRRALFGRGLSSNSQRMSNARN
jgi:hypothetical protein